MILKQTSMMSIYICVVLGGIGWKSARGNLRETFEVIGEWCNDTNIL